MSTIKKMMIACFFSILWTNAIAAINVCGLISNGTVWSIADSPVNVTCDLNIAELTVEAGVEVKITGDYELVVSGVIHSLGSPESPVIFKPADDNATGWGGFFFEDAANGSEFRWSEIEGATDSAIHLVRSTPSFDHVTFTSNSATHGGAIRAELLNSNLQISNSRFIDNSATTAGGAIYAITPIDSADVELKVTGSIFLQNIAGTTGISRNTSGGAIHINGNSRILRSTFRENEAQAYTINAPGGRYTRGGAIYTTGGKSVINATSFLQNACRMGAHFQTPDFSRAHGGALHLASGELLLSNSLLAENMLIGGRRPDPRGSGVYISSGVNTIVNSTLVYNSTHAVYQHSGQVDILNSILFFNNDSGAQIAGSVLATYSDIQNSYVGEGNINLNPILNERFGIVMPSPAIDTGHPSPQHNDLFPPGLGSERNDMGYFGGRAAIFSPIANAGSDQNIDERNTVILDGTNSNDLDGDSLTYTWVQISGLSVNLSNATGAQPIFIAPEVIMPTSLAFELTVSDGVTSSNPNTVNITVNNVNRTPTADAGINLIVIENSTVKLNGNNSRDLDGDSLTYTWTQTSGPVNDLSNANDIQPTFVAPDISEATVLFFELVVNDGLINSIVDTIKITVVEETTDTDNDGLTDIEETIQYGSDPYRADTDGDGVNDGDEIAAGTNPLVNVSAIMSIIHFIFEED